MRPAEMLLLAAGLDWLEGLLPFLFVLIWIVSQVLGLFRKAANNPPAKPAAPRPRAGRQVEAGDPIDREIEEFLVRSVRQEQRQRAGKRSSRRGSRSGQRRVEAGLEGPPPLPPSVAADRQEDVSEHVAAAFAHDLVHESPTDAAAPGSGQVASPTTELLAALRSPAGLRQLILMREVLDRPTYRW